MLPQLHGRKGPKYKALAEAYADMIDNGEIKAGTKLPSQRILSYQLGVTVGTVTRAYQELSLLGKTLSVVGSGTYVKEALSADSYYHPLDSQQGIDLSLCRPLIVSQQQHLHNALQQMLGQPQAQSVILDYFSADGLCGHSDTLRQWLNQRWHSKLTPERVQWTYGGQHGLSVILQALTRSGDTVLTEGLCYGEFIHSCAQLERRLQPVAIDEQGLVAEDLLLQCQRHRPRLLYLTANVQNPTAVQLSAQRRLEIIDICRRFDVLIIEDGVMYCPPEQRQLPLASIAPDITVYVGSFSKYFAGGVRVGYLVLPANLRVPLLKALRSTCMHVSPILIDLICRWLCSGAMAEVDNHIAMELRARYRILAQHLERPADHVIQGFNYWLTLPPQHQAERVTKQLYELGVRVRSGQQFCVGGYGQANAIRLSLTGPKTRDELRAGLEIVRSCVR
ncbi:aminotransferase-like domain-containing protein [Pseudoalteromonas ruthenica]|uniref:aminotransferase-like domain-containing protein n=1 Tax=Pseudoalteromonas ruthenica TaxID=151081 RepID=UPI001C55182A|nr:PLP-dependent aminotransferase family protein [Pseudoalteromonas ruthenica]